MRSRSPSTRRSLALVTLELTWKHAGPPVPSSIEVPPVSIGNYSYALVYDENRQRMVYVRAADHGAKLEAWTFDGRAWTCDDTPTTNHRGHERHSYYDPDRAAIVSWSVDFDHRARRHLPTAVLVDAASIRNLETSGDPPLLDPSADDTLGSSDIGCGITFDPDRRVAVCLARHGVWELDGENVWKRVGDAPGLPAEWHKDAGGTYDPVTKRCMFWMQQRGDGYKHRLYAWDGALSEVSLDGLPSLHIGLFDPIAHFIGHPRHGLLLQIGGEHGIWALSGSTWQRLPDAANPPPRTGGRTGCCMPHVAIDPHGTLVLGPGFHDRDRGGAEPQRVFYVLRDGAWEQQGVVTKQSLVNTLYGHRHHAVANGVWYATAYRALHTVCCDAAGWREVVDEKTGDKLSNDDRHGGIAGTPDGLLAVSQHGAVSRLDGDRYTEVAKGAAAFKERVDFLLAHDGSRLVAWGGTIKNRKSNDTLWFDGTTWTANKKASPAPTYKTDAQPYIDFTIVHDTTLGALVRFGYQEAMALVGELWQPITPPSYESLISARKWSHVPAHDPETGETLLVDFEKAHVIRFDLAGCTVVATFSYPQQYIDAANLERRPVHFWFSEAAVYMPETRTIESQRAEDQWHRFSLDLGPVFAAAKALGPRAKLEVSAAPAKKAKAPTKK